jgi:hypothetical protein
MSKVKNRIGICWFVSLTHMGEEQAYDKMYFIVV